MDGKRGMEVEGGREEGEKKGGDRNTERRRGREGGQAS